jgi:hypothetical protein
MSESKTLDIWALVIAAFSFVLSGASLWYSVTQVNLTKGQVKAYAQVTEAKLVEPLAGASFVKVQLKIKNFGQTAAVDVSGDMDYNDAIPGASGEPNDASMLRLGSMGPGFERTVTLTSNRRSTRSWPAPSTRGENAIYFYGTVWYTDDTTREDRKDDWCFRLVLRTEEDLKKTEIEPCTILQYESKRDPRRNQ